MGRGVAALGLRYEASDLSRRRDLFGRWSRHRDIAWHAFLKEKFCGLDHCFRMLNRARIASIMERVSVITPMIVIA